MSMQLKLIPIYLENKELFGMAGHSTDMDTVMSVEEYSEVHNYKIINNINNFDKKTLVHTDMNNEKLIISSINKYAERFEDEDLLNDFLDKGSISFNKSDNGTYDLIFYGYFSDEEIIYISNEIFDYYKKVNKNSIKSQDISNNQKLNSTTITPMKDKKIISDVLSKLYENNYISQDILIDLSLNKDNTYDLIINGLSPEKSTEMTKRILEEYELNIQELNYNKIIEKLKKQKHTVESENIDNNDSIILTVNL